MTAGVIYGNPYLPAPGGPAPIGPGINDQLLVPFNVSWMAYEVARFLRTVIFRIIGLAITILIWVGIFIWRNRTGSTAAIFGWPSWVLIGASSALSLGMLAYAIFRWRRADGRAHRIVLAPALVISRSGVFLAGEHVPWPAVSALAARTVFGRGDVFVLTRAGGADLEVPMELLQAAPSSLDSAARAFSGSRFGIDFSKLDN